MPPKTDPTTSGSSASASASGAVAPDPMAAMSQMLQQLLAGQTNNGESNNIAAISVKPATFWTDKPNLWFTKLEAQFDLAGITVEKTKFNYVLQSLDNAVIQEVETVVASPRANHEYHDIKEALLAAFDQSQESKDKALFALNGLGDRKPSSMLRHIRSLSTDLDTIVKAFFLAQLPVEVRSVLAAQTFPSVDDMAKAADRIMETRQLGAGVAAISETQVSNESNIAAVAKSKSNEPFICTAHRKYGPKAFSCKPNCLWAGTPLAPRPTAGNAPAARR